MAWISRDGYLTQSEMENNADIIIAYYRSIGVNDNTIAALLGNMQAESTLSPTLTERGGGGGYGLVQWTPQSDLINACNILNLTPYTSGDNQIRVIIQEIRGIPQSINQWYTSIMYISNYYNSGATSDMIGITPQDFLSNTMGWSPDKLAVLFMAGYERPSYDPNINHYTNRQQNALNWLSYMGGSTYIPRLDDTGIVGDFHYYSENPFYQSGYGLPNCTCYAWGRFWEIGDPNDTGEHKPVNLPTGDGYEWFGRAVSGGYYETGQTPRLGAVICFSDNNHPTSGGHVAIVEQINNDNSIVTSNSAYGGAFFYLSNISPVNGRYDTGHYTFQGFIYNPYAYQPSPIPKKKKKDHYNFVLFNRRKRFEHEQTGFIR